MATKAKKQKRWRPKEEHLEVLDDYMHNRGQFVGSDADGHKGLKYAFPHLTRSQRQIAIDKWKRESDNFLDSGDDREADWYC